MSSCFAISKITLHIHRMNPAMTIKIIQCIQELVISIYILAKIKKTTHQSIKASNLKSKKSFMVPFLL